MTPEQLDQLELDYQMKKNRLEDLRKSVETGNQRITELKQESNPDEEEVKDAEKTLEIWKCTEKQGTN